MNFKVGDIVVQITDTAYSYSKIGAVGIIKKVQQSGCLVVFPDCENRYGHYHSFTQIVHVTKLSKALK